MSNIDFSQTVTADAKAAAAAADDLAQRRADCRMRILAVMNEAAQVNLAAAAGAGMLAERMDTYRAALAWVGAMRAACASGGEWPAPPAAAADLAREY